MNTEDEKLMLFEFVNSWDLINEEQRTEHDDDETRAANTSDTWTVRSGSQQSLLLEVC